MNRNRRRLMTAYEHAMNDAVALSSSLETLSNIASELYGTEVTADLCNGYEIEFRENDEHGYVDDGSTIRIEDILNKIDRTNDWQL